MSRIGFNFKDAASAADSGKKWFPYNKGGGFRRWYGLNENIVNWENNGEEIKSFEGAVIRNPSYYFKESITFPRIGSNSFYARYSPSGSIFDCNGPSCFPDSDSDRDFILGFQNSCIMTELLRILCPTLSFQIGDSFKVPIVHKTNPTISSLVQQNISISKQDWDAHETSWDFQRNELFAIDEPTGIDPSKLNSLEWRTEQYKTKWERFFHQLHANEEELNRQFIEIYGLQDELTPDVPLNEVTILQQGEISFLPAPGDTSGKQASIQWNDDVIIKQLLSYAVGCMMGRYSLDKDGLILANQGDGIDQYNELVPNSRFMIDDDGILPLMSSNSEFTDIATRRFKFWLEAAFGEDALVENLNFVEKCLGKSLDDYFVKDFWKDHKKMYQNRPIYWLFSSKKGAFQCLVYMHRMNPYTAEKVRTNYLLPHIEWLVARQAEMQDNAANLSTKERKELDNIGKQIDECREYHDRLHTIADQQIAFDLDDGILVNHAKLGDILTKLK